MADSLTKEQKIAAAREKLRAYQNQQKKKAETRSVAENANTPSSSLTVPTQQSTGVAFTPLVSSSNVSTAYSAPYNPGTVIESKQLPLVDNPISSVAAETISSTMSDATSFPQYYQVHPLSPKRVPSQMVSSCETQSSEISIDMLDDSSNLENETRLPVLTYFSKTGSISQTSSSFFDHLSPSTSVVHLQEATPCKQNEDTSSESFVNILHADVENGAVFHDELVHDNVSDVGAGSVLSTLDSTSDYTHKLTTQDSVEQTTSQCSDISELERKNDELVEALNMEQKRCEEINAQFLSYKEKMEAAVEEMKLKEASINAELQKANENARMQLEALNMLTSENSSLQNELQRIQKKLDESFARIKELESQVPYEEDLRKQLEGLQLDYKNLDSKESKNSELVASLESENKSLLENLRQSTNMCEELENRLKEAECTILSLQEAQRMQNDSGEFELKYNSMVEQTKRLQEEVSGLRTQVQCLVYERDQMQNGYQNCIDDLNVTYNSTVSKFRELETENTSLKEKLSSQTDHISFLEKQLQRTQELGIPSISDSADHQQLLDDLKTALQNQEELNSTLNNSLQESVSSVLLNIQELRNKERFLESRIFSLENEIEQLRSERADVEKLQSSIESDKVAASQAIMQNNKLKKEYETLYETHVALTEANSKLVLDLDHQKTLCQRLQQKVEQLIPKDTKKEDTSTNTEINEDGGSQNKESSCDTPVNMKAMVQLQDKFKDVVNRMADLTDEKQQLEHLVLQLQSETETIGEYVTLYQKQRYLLNEKARQKDRQFELTLKEKELLYQEVRRLTSAIALLPPSLREAVEQKTGLHFENLIPIKPGCPGSGETSAGKEDDILHPTSCNCSGRRLLTV